MSLDFVDLISIIACLYETVSSSLSMLMTFCLLKRISQLFRTLNNVLMTHSRCQISVRVLLSRHESETNHTEHTICLTQTAYINKVLQTFQQLQTVSVNTLWILMQYSWRSLSLRLTSLSFDISESSQITNVHYVADTFWHHLVISTVSQFAQNLNTSHYNAVKWIFKYLADTMNLSVIYDITDDDLINYINADWGGCHNIRKFTEAYLFLLYEGFISWCFKCQQSLLYS
jgi:hypothetical protein